MDRYVCRLGGVGYKYVVNRVKEDRAEKQHVNKTDLIPDVSGINHYSGNNHYNTGICIYRYGDIYMYAYRQYIPTYQYSTLLLHMLEQLSALNMMYKLIQNLSFSLFIIIYSIDDLL